MLGYLIGGILSLAPSRERTIAALQIKRFLPKTIEPPSLWSVYGSFGATFAEVINLTPLLYDLTQVECENLTLLDSLIAERKPIVALTGHVGNWDFLAAFVIQRGGKLVTVGRKARNPKFQDLLTKIRSRYGIETIWRSDRGGARKLVQALRNSFVVAALIDQDTEVRSRFIPFFSCPANTPDSLVEMARRNNAALVTAFVARVGWGKFRIIIEEIPESASPDEALTIYSQRLEAVIKSYPEQWVWVHKRWRTRPEGEKLNSNDYIKFLRTYEPSASISSVLT